MKVERAPLEGVLLLEPDVFADDRGHFMEVWRDTRYAEWGIRGPFVQDNVSFSRHGVLRGMHFQNPNPQGKLVTCIHGEVFDVVVDIRKGSSTFGQWFGSSLSFENGRQLYIPPGFAHGFVVTSESASFLYKCTAAYDPRSDHSLAWNDPEVGIEWPIREPTLSEKDRRAPRLRDLPEEWLRF